MIVLLDFDGTLFHTEAFKEDAGMTDVSCIDHPERCLDILARRGPLDAFLFPDTVDFLRRHAHYNLILMTFGDPEFQKAKVIQSGIFGFFSRSIFTGTEMKGEAVGRLFSYGGETTVFLDDDPAQLQNMKEHCPYVILVRMKRGGVALRSDAEQSDFPEVSDLDGFARFISDAE